MRKYEGSIIAGDIMREYRMKEFYKKKKERQKCKEIECDRCKYNNICKESGTNDI